MSDAVSLALIVMDLAKYVPHAQECSSFAPLQWEAPEGSIAAIVRTRQGEPVVCTCGRNEFVAYMRREAERIAGWSPSPEAYSG